MYVCMCIYVTGCVYVCEDDKYLVFDSWVTIEVILIGQCVLKPQKNNSNEGKVTSIDSVYSRQLWL